mgnify:CR=1 FL=1
MKKIAELKGIIAGGEFDEKLAQIYLDKDMIPYNRERYVKALDKFTELFGDQEVAIYSAPGRSEVCGNHTDHQNGHVLATSINLDAIAIVAPREDGVIELVSDDMPKEVINVNDIEQDPALEGTTTALIKGVVAGIRDYGFKVGGFTAFVTSDVLMGAGMSSSAAFESLIGTILSGLYNDMKVSSVDVAKIGQYAENVYWDKASGMMDQMACAVGGPVLFDFADRDNLKYSKLDFSFGKFGYRLVIVNTGKGHADLSQEYSEIPGEMKAVAKVLGVELLHETNVDALLEHCNEIEDDRAVLRALHFFGETSRVEDAADAIHHNDYDKFLELIDESGKSSWELLQNCYTMKDFHEQKITRTLALTQLFLKKIGAGVCRVHGGGFAGVIAAIVPEKEQDNYVEYISRFVGKENVYPMDIRAIGAVHIG